ncbi:DsbA family protein [Candidatus Pelagibacter sp.]|jgi:2-hydroxychromene-2-carboxylate isomerase|nr:DsbA family protein [Candidatus Pelagibacter sp.]|tara:strand:- start:18 stop:602 length:585 start_codon:yes stop_codon:yes gene_type:complete
MTKSIDFYFDIISPYSYLAHQKIKVIKKNKKILFNYKPILVGGLHNLQGITAPAFIKPKLKHMISDCNLIAIKDNFDFTWNSKFPINSLSIMRGYLFVNTDIKDLYLDKIFDAYWKDNLDISDEEILISLIKKCKIDPSTFMIGIKNLNIKNELINSTKEAHDKEIFGAPTYVVNDKIFWGQDRLEFALDEYNK